MKLYNKVKSLGTALMLALVTALVPVAAMAQGTEIGDTVSTAIAGANPQIVAVVGAMAAALVLIVVWSLVKRAMGK